MRIGTKDIPDECGDFCPIYRRNGFGPAISYQGDTCSRCALFLCKQLPEIGYIGMPPEEYSLEFLARFIDFWNKPLDKWVQK